MSASCCWLVDPTITPEALKEACAGDSSHYMSKKSGEGANRYMKTLCGYDTLHKFTDMDQRIILKYKSEGANCAVCIERDRDNPGDTVGR